MRLQFLLRLTAATVAIILDIVQAGFFCSSSEDVPSMSARGAKMATARAKSLRLSSSLNRQAVQSDSQAQDIAHRLVRYVQPQLKEQADPARAATMQAYLKTDMPMYGIQQPGRALIENRIWEFLGTETEGTIRQKELPMDLYQRSVGALWELPRREEKYLAINVAQRYQDCIQIQSLPLYEQMLREDYAWWDLVDPIAINLVGKLTFRYPSEMKPILNQWIGDDNMWIRRTAILAQLKFKERMDEELLFQFCRQCMHEKEFFIRKAIGWVLREYSKTEPDVVRAFLEKEKTNLSVLSYREGSKVLVKRGLL